MKVKKADQSKIFINHYKTLYKTGFLFFHSLDVNPAHPTFVKVCKCKMDKKVLILTTAHSTHDDRLYYHFGKSLTKEGYQVYIFSTYKGSSSSSEGIITRFINCDGSSKVDKIESVLQHVLDLQPDIAICPESLPVQIMQRFKKCCSKKVKVLYDVTEYYPVKRNVHHVQPILRPIYWILLFLYHIWQFSKTDGFIYGEYYKGIMYRILFPLKPNKSVSYYFSEVYVEQETISRNSNNFCFGYAGVLSKAKGFDYFVDFLLEFDKSLDERKKYAAKVIGWYVNKEEAKLLIQRLDGLRYIQVEIKKALPFQKFINEIKDFDIAFDLRRSDLLIKRSLPIKLFLYSMLGIPSFYSRNKAIERIPEHKQLCMMVKPDDASGLVDKVNLLINNQKDFQKFADNARKVCGEKYNWNNINSQFLCFINSFKT